MARLLVCNTCKTVDKLNDYATENDPQALHDHELIDACDTHKMKYPRAGDVHAAQLLNISDEELELIDEGALKQAVHDNKLEEFIRNERENYKEDAMGCYNLHNRPTYGIGYGVGCTDYRDKKKAIGRTTGIPKDEWSYVCDFCPYHSYVEHYSNRKVNWK